MFSHREQICGCRFTLRSVSLILLWEFQQLLKHHGLQNNCFCVCDVFGVGTSDTQRDAVYELTVMLCFSQHAPILQSVTGADVIADWLNQSAKACSEFTHVAGCA